MKKVLLGTSAIALASAMATPASAVEWNLEWGGYFEAYAAYASSDVDNVSGEDHDGIDQKQDAEIAFTPSITLDNGIEIGINIQLEGSSGTPDTIDEAFLFIDGSFGRVLIGSENSAGYLMTYAAPDVTFVNVNSGSLTAFVPFSGTAGANSASNSPITGGAGVLTGADVFRGTLGTTFLENERNNDANRFTYFTPRFAGVQVGLSYARDGAQDSNAQLDLNGASLRDIFDVGANYVNSFGGVDIAVSGRYGIASNDAPGGDNPQIWSAGLNLGFAGVTVGGSFAEQNNAGTEDGQAYDVGISYGTGPWGVSFTYFKGENVNDETPTALTGNDEELAQYLAGVTYKLATGVTLMGFGAYVDFEEDTGDAGGSGDDVDGFVIGTGIKVSF